MKKAFQAIFVLTKGKILSAGILKQLIKNAKHLVLRVFLAWSFIFSNREVSFMINFVLPRLHQNI